jgi:hypothetical protein
MPLPESRRRGVSLSAAEQTHLNIRTRQERMDALRGNRLRGKFLWRAVPDEVLAAYHAVPTANGGAAVRTGSQPAASTSSLPEGPTTETPISASLPSICSPVTIAAPSPLVGVADVSVDASLRLRSNLNYPADSLAAEKMRECMGSTGKLRSQSVSIDANKASDEVSELSNATTCTSSSMAKGQSQLTSEQEPEDVGGVEELVQHLERQGNPPPNRYISWPKWQPDEGVIPMSTHDSNPELHLHAPTLACNATLKTCVALMDHTRSPP